MTTPAQSFNINSASQADLDKELIGACEKNTSIADIQALLKAGANPNTLNESKADCLLMAVLRRNDALVKELLQHGADPNYAGFTFGKTALMWAAHMGQRKNVIALLDAGADPEATSHNGKTAADWADDNNKIAVKEMIRDFIHDKKGATEQAVKAAAAKAERDEFNKVLQQGIPLQKALRPMKTIRLKRADMLRP
ncbi:MAG TPA: ankyrin repeat domain-containing protein [Alphaproteobacteria bacterium]|nr:ankyrin repeat domain-containing protein [Alphaproteobacteria bacterium]